MIDCQGRAALTECRLDGQIRVESIRTTTDLRILQIYGLERLRIYGFTD
jgi:hypothetical protein